MVAAIHAYFVDEMASGRWTARDEVDRILEGIDEKYRPVDAPETWGESPQAAEGLAAAQKLTEGLKRGDS